MYGTLNYKKSLEVVHKSNMILIRSCLQRKGGEGRRKEYLISNSWYNLHSTSSSTYHSNPLPCHIIIALPACGMEPGTTECISSPELRHYRNMEGSNTGYYDISF